ncbi:MAG: class I SAM-dependent methyltransferase [Desulfovibrio sp.]|nr:class I SAM-dependent methyltransferase [Desulfovibrio sp.]
MPEGVPEGSRGPILAHAPRDAENLRPMPPADGPFATRTIEEVAAFWDRRPCNVRHSLREPGTREYFDEVERRKYLVEPHIPAFAEFSRWRGKRVLEVGCGIGTDTMNFARNGARVTAVDISAASLSLARKRAEIFGIAEAIDFRLANAEDLGRHVPIEPYDLVYAFGVVHHTPNPKAAIRSMRAYMDDASVMKLMVYSRLSLKVLEIAASRLLDRPWEVDRHVAERSEAQTGCPVTYTYTRRTLARLLEGLTATRIFKTHVFPYVVADYVRHVHRLRPIFRAMGPRLFKRLESVAGWHLCVDARLAEGGPSAPCGNDAATSTESFQRTREERIP